MKRIINKYKIEENEEDLRFKKFINRMNDIFGEDYVLLMFTSDQNMDCSIRLFSSKFGKLTNEHIKSLLLIDAVLSQRNKYHVLFTKKINNDNCFDLFFKIDNDVIFKKELIREFIKDCHITNKELIEKNKNESEKERLTHNYRLIKEYEMFLRSQNEFLFRKSLKKRNYN